MSALDPRTPILIGAGQVSVREGDVPSPIALAAEALRQACADAGPGGDAMLAGVQSLAVVDPLTWQVPDPGALVAAELGLAPQETVRSAIGGNGPVALLGDLSARITAGELDVAAITGAEAMTPFMSAMGAGESPDWQIGGDGPAATRVVGIAREGQNAAEQAAGLLLPIIWYPLFENAIRGAARRTPEEHQTYLGELWEGFSRVAADNPFAWTRTAFSAREIATPGPANRRVSFPYTKLMNANIQVDQGAALLLCSVGAAQAAGISPDRWVFVSATAQAHDHWWASEREAWHRSPALAACGAALRDHTGVEANDVDELDIYSCFPSAVQVAAAELGIDVFAPERPPTVTGGLGFAGGPANNYVTHALATLVGRLRESDGPATGLATAVGWYLTKHGLALLSNVPAAAPFADLDLQAVVDTQPRRTLSQQAATAPIESYTVLFARDGSPTSGIVSCLLADGSRGLARSEDATTLSALLDGDALGRDVALDGANGFSI